MNEFKRVLRAARFSFLGIGAAWRDEPAFRTECLLLLIAVPSAFWLSKDPWHLALLISSILLVMLVELLNSAIEAAIDRISDERHPLAGKAKDCGSAAVFVSLLIVAVIWCAALIDKFTSPPTP